MFYFKKDKGISAAIIVTIILLAGAVASIMTYTSAKVVVNNGTEGTYEAYEILTGNELDTNKNNSSSIFVPSPSGGIQLGQASNPEMTYTVSSDEKKLFGTQKLTNSTAPELPEDALPETSTFIFGEFEASSEYIPGNYTVEHYEVTKTGPKLPRVAVQFTGVSWKIEENGNYVKDDDTGLPAFPLDESVGNVSSYVIYVKNNNSKYEVDGVKGASYNVCTFFSDATLDDVAYAAAYYRKTDGLSWKPAVYNGSGYSDLNIETEISKITNFTTTYTEIISKVVQVSTPSNLTSYSYVPTETMVYEPGMTWSAWLNSDYNTTGITDKAIKTSNYEDVSLAAKIDGSKSYGFEVNVWSVTIEPGVYNLNTGEMIVTWAEIEEMGLFENYGGQLLHMDNTVTLNDLSESVCLVLGTTYNGEIVNSLDFISIGSIAYVSGGNPIKKVIVPEGYVEIYHDGASIPSDDIICDLYVPTSVMYIHTAGKYNPFDYVTIYYAGSEAQWSQVYSDSGSTQGNVVCKGVVYNTIPKEVTS